MAAHGAEATRLTGLHHFTIRCQVQELDGLLAFYRDVLGLRPGPRPAFPFQGHWLYLGAQAVVHIAAIAPDDAAGPPSAGSGFDHMAFAATDIVATRALLQRLHLAFEEAPVPGWPMVQIFVRDPVGTKLELNFEVQP
jgi:catechol 2,3-dioxygenase-like lactoylglutathione lyase family enzyme